MRSQKELQNRLEECKKSLNNAEVEDFHRGRINALEKIIEKSDEDYAVRLLRRSNNMTEFYDQMALLFGRLQNIGVEMTKSSAYHDGVIIECAFALNADLDLKSDQQEATFNDRSVSI